MHIGEHIFFVPHGVARVVSIENMVVADQKLEFCVFRLLDGATLKIPTTLVDGDTVRPLVSQRKARQLLKQVKTKPEHPSSLATKERATQFAESLKTGLSDNYTDILQELMYRAKCDKISAMEQRLLEQARTYFVGEIGTVLEIASDQLNGQLEEATYDD